MVYNIEEGRDYCESTRADIRIFHAKRSLINICTYKQLSIAYEQYVCCNDNIFFLNFQFSIYKTF